MPPKKRARGGAAAGAGARRGVAPALVHPPDAAADSDADAGGPGELARDRDADDASFLALLFDGAGAGGRVGVALYERAGGRLTLAASPCRAPDECAHFAAAAAALAPGGGGPTVSLVLAGSLPPDAAAELTRGGGRVEPRRALTFGLAGARETLLRLTTAELAAAAPAGGAGGGRAAASLRLGGLLDAGDALLVRAAGGLLAWLESERALRVADDDDDGGGGGGGGGEGGRGAGLAVLPGSVTTVSFADSMAVDAATLLALQAFPAPGRSLSLLGLLDRTRSGAGSRVLRAWLRRPSASPAVLRARHDAVAFLLCARAQAPDAWGELRAAARGGRDVDGALTRILRARAGPGDWAALESTLTAAARARAALADMLATVRVPPALHAGGAVDAGDAGGAGDAMDAGDAGDGDDAGGGAAAPPPSPPRSSAQPSASRPALLTEFLAATAPEGAAAGVLAILQAVIDWPATRAERGGGSGGGGAGRRLAVLDGVDESLDEHRRLAAELPEALAAEAVGEAARYSGLPGVALKYVPQLGVVLTCDRPGTARGGSGAGGAGGGGGRGGGADGGGGRGGDDDDVWGDGGGGGGGGGGARGGAARGGGARGGTPVPLAPRAGALPAPSELELQFETSEEVVFKSPRCRELDAYYGDVASAVRSLEASVVRQLEARVLAAHDGALRAAGGALAGVDALAALADVAGDGGWSRPTLVGAPVLLAKRARHPLQGAALDAAGGGGAGGGGGGGGAGAAAAAAVPNDVALAAGRAGAGPILVLSGPNGSGKSVLLKTVGALALLAQAGSFVPAERLVLGVVDRLVCRGASVESSAVPASAFALDAQALAAMLRGATARSLLLVDELGKGTSATDAAALLAAAVRALARAPDPPRAVFTTHYHEVLELGLLSSAAGGGAGAGAGGAASGGGGAGLPADAPAPPAGATPNVSFYTMAVMIDRARGGGSADADGGGGGGAWDDVVTPLFRLTPGRADGSYGLACARRAGLPESVLRRAGAVAAALRRGAPVPPAEGARAFLSAADVADAEAAAAALVGGDDDAARAALEDVVRRRRARAAGAA